MTRLPAFKKRRPDVYGPETECDRDFLANNNYLAVALLERHGRINAAPTPTDIKQFFEHAETAALTLIEQRAREILKKRPTLKEFVMGMGSAQFTLKKPMPYGDCLKVDSFAAWDDAFPRYLKPVFDIINEWDCVLKLTGTPMRFTATGPKVADW